MKRREFIALLTAAIGAPAMALSETLARTIRIDDWANTHDRVFLGGGVWANPMEDWRVQDGWAACQTAGGARNIQSLLYRLTDASQPFTMSVEMARPDNMANDTGGGMRLGVRASDIDDHRADCFARNGYRMGMIKGDTLVIAQKTKKLANPVKGPVTLMLVGKPEGGKTQLTLTAVEPKTGKAIGTLTHALMPDQIQGNIALASQFTGSEKRTGTGYRFRNWEVSGEALTHYADRSFGPIMWSMYSLSDNRDDDGFVLKLTALVGPMGKQDNKTVELEVEREGKWQPIAKSDLDTDAWTATFRLPNWDASKTVPYRVVYREKKTNGGEQTHTWPGTIKANPTEPVRIGAMTCQNAVGFPYKPVADNLLNLDTDLLFFSGDQLYEAHGGFGIIRNPADPAILNYLRKFYMFGWAFREAMANAPTICIPDDHDVFHGNIWGEAGAPYNPAGKGSSSYGGYLQPAKMVNAVHKTQCSHHPDFASPRPVKQDISVYYGDMIYGGVGFAIIADRQWKSGPEKSGNKGTRIDHVKDPNIDPKTLDKPGLVMLGQRQEKFLEDWAKDWRGHTMKVVLSQTVFAGAATHHGGYDGYLVADLDSGAWPQTARNRTIDILREAMPLHICGDQHLASAVQYGVEKQRDAFWAFCTPAICVGYQRWWRADEVGMPHQNRPKHGIPHTGEYLDGLGNKAYMYTIANPGKDFRQGGGSRYDFAQRKASGFGLVTIDTIKKTYTLEAFKFLCDATDGKPSNQYPGWPITIHQDENKGDNRVS
ncbi:MAG: alkaline phosphatase D family protein [Planctomycetota bacterium]